MSQHLPPPQPPSTPPLRTHASMSSASVSSGSRKRKRADEGARDGDNSDKGSSSTPKRTASSSTRGSGPEFSRVTRKKVLDADGDKCWFCGAHPAQLCHVIGQKDHGFLELVAKRLLCFDDLSSSDNAIPLCGTCHANFDDIIHPGLIFIPVDLEYFINYEMEDQKRRQKAVKDGGILPGRFGVPTAEKYRDHERANKNIAPDTLSGRYIRYVLRKFLPEMLQYEIGQFGEPKQWYGSPSASLRRACMLVGNTAVSGRGVPREIRSQLQRLADLWMDLEIEEWNTQQVSQSQVEDDSDTAGINNDRREIDGSRQDTSERNTSEQPGESGSNSQPSRERQVYAHNVPLNVTATYEFSDAPQKHAAVRSENQNRPDQSVKDFKTSFSTNDYTLEHPPPLEKDGHTLSPTTSSSSDGDNNECQSDPKSWRFGPNATSKDAADFFAAVNPL